MNKNKEKPEAKKKILAYIRVSTNEQDIKNQEWEISKYCLDNNLSVGKNDWIKVEVSSRKDTIDRRIKELLEKLEKGDFKTLIVTEASRLSRTIGELLYLFEKIEKDLGVEVIETKEPESYHLPKEYKLMRRIFAGYFAEQERNIISLRTKEALASKKSQGIIGGRKPGALQKSKYDHRKDDILLWLSKGIDLTNIIRFLGFGKALSLKTYLKKRNLLPLKESKNKKIN
jgi:DNA invertase Pin-like site-specific DNA recombinase